MNQIDLDQSLINNEQFLKKLYFKEIDFRNCDDKYFFYHVISSGIDYRMINFLKKHGYSITSIYPSFQKIGILEISLKWKIQK